MLNTLYLIPGKKNVILNTLYLIPGTKKRDYRRDPKGGPAPFKTHGSPASTLVFSFMRNA